MVTIFWFGFSAASGNAQERTAAPSMCTVHDPHWAMPQPYLVPVSQLLAQHPQQRRVGLGLEHHRLAIHIERGHASVSFPETGLRRSLGGLRRTDRC